MTGEVTIRLKGGLGNQLFMYFAGANLANNLGAALTLDISGLSEAKQLRSFELNQFDLPVPYYVIESRVKIQSRHLMRLYKIIQDIFLVSRGYSFWRPKSLGYEIPIKGRRRIILDGYFQSFRYVQELKDEIGTFFLLKENLNVQDDHLDSLNAGECISVHVRRSDFLPLAQTIGVLDRRYYRKAILRALRIYPSSKILLFGDDMDFLRALQEEFPNSIIPELQYPLTTRGVLQLISSSKCIVSSNSTFCWWACYFSENAVLIFPGEWHKNHEIPDLLFKDSIISLPPIWE